MLAGQALTMGDTLLVSLIGMCVVMLELVLLALMIIVLAKVVNRLTGQGKAVQPAAPAAPAPRVGVDRTGEQCAPLQYVLPEASSGSSGAGKRC